MNRLTFLLGFFSLILLTSCARKYSNTTYDKHPINNKTIAILPYEVVTTGRIPKDITPEILEEIEEGESIAFQSSLYHQILERLSRRRYQHLNIKVQGFTETNRKIEKAGYSIRESWSLNADEMAEILGVDAVMRSYVHKTKYLTDLESFGIHLTHRVIDALTRSSWLYTSGWYTEKTSDVRISSTIIDSNDGSTLWAASRKHPTNWNLRTQDAIERINYRISKALPQ